MASKNNNIWTKRIKIIYIDKLRRTWMNKNFYKIIFLGSVWGITEATLGHILHTCELPIGWLVWFPVAYFFLSRAYNLTGNINSVVYTALISASIKLIDLFFSPRFDYVLNPAVSILLEAFAFLAVYKFIVSKNESDKLNVMNIFIIGFLWKILYISYLFILPKNLLNISPVSTSISFVKFFFLETVTNTALIIGVAFACKKTKPLSFSFFIKVRECYESKLVFPISTFALAVAIQILL